MSEGYRTTADEISRVHAELCRISALANKRYGEMIRKREAAEELYKQLDQIEAQLNALRSLKQLEDAGLATFWGRELQGDETIEMVQAKYNEAHGIAA